MPIQSNKNTDLLCCGGQTSLEGVDDFDLGVGGSQLNATSAEQHVNHSFDHETRTSSLGGNRLQGE